MGYNSIEGDIILTRMQLRINRYWLQLLFLSFVTVLIIIFFKRNGHFLE